MLARLDSLFSGCVDAYHATAYSPDFSKHGLRALRAAPKMRPAFKACCGDFSGISEYYEQGEFDEGAEFTDRDFRTHPFTLNDKEAATGEHRLQQVPYPGADAPAFDAEKPPEVRPSLPELALAFRATSGDLSGVEEHDEPAEFRPSLPEFTFDDEDILEGIEFIDPTPRADTHARLALSLEDPVRMLPDQVGKWLSDTLGSIFRAAALGYFETSSGAGRMDGSYAEFSFSVGFKGDPQRALQVIRETLWWVGAPGDTNLDAFALTLSQPPGTTESRFLQLAEPKVERWHFDGKPRYTSARNDGLVLLGSDSLEP